MPAQTRSRAKAPSSRVYHSSPAPAQLEFPRRRKVVKTYGRHSLSARSLRQQTLTQIGYVDPVEPENLDMDDEIPDERPQKRRKTMGDTPSSSFHTQTLTQMLSTAGDDEDEDLLRLEDSDHEQQHETDGDDPEIQGNKTGPVPKKALSHVTDSRATSMVPQTPVHRKGRTDVWEVPSSQQTPGTPFVTTPLDTERFRIQPLRSPLQDKTPNINAPLPTSKPATKRPPGLVIADSYSSAPGFPSSDTLQSPLKSTRLPYVAARASTELGESIPESKPAPGTPAVGKASATSSRRVLGDIGVLEIPDSDDELQSLGPSPLKTEATKTGITKSEDGATPLSSLTPRGAAGTRGQHPILTTPKVSSDDDDREVASSDTDFDPGSPTPVARKVHSKPRPSSLEKGLLHSNVVLAPAPNAALEDHVAVTPTPFSRSVHIEVPKAREEEAPAALTSTPCTSQQPTPSSPPSHNTRSHKVGSEIRKDAPDEEVHEDSAPAKSQFYTQGLESQRVPLEVIRSMAPQTDRSDIIVSIHPEPANLIVSGAKNHEFRNYKIPNTVSRIWIYVTRPICELRYMAVIGPAKQPGEIDELGGIGNREFNAQSGDFKYKFAYELQQVYQLNNPVSLARMKENGWVEGPPQKYVYIPPAVVGQLLGNLRCSLFDEESQSNLPSNHDDSQRILSTPQEIEDQLQSDINHSTELASEGVGLSNDIVLSSQGQSSRGQETLAAKPTSDSGFARPQLPASRIPASRQKQPTQPSTPSQPSLPRNTEINGIRPSQATTASEPSSPVVSPEKSVPRPALGSSGLSFPEEVDDESPAMFLAGEPYSLGSSQVRLPESLFVDDVRPPPEVWDSDEE